MKKGINVVIMDNQNRILILKRSPNVEFSPSIWDLPGGRVESNENLKEAVIRETKEESGLEVEPEDTYFYVYHYPNGQMNVYAFRAQLISGSVQLDEEHTEFRWISEDDWRNLKYTPSVAATLKELFK